MRKIKGSPQPFGVDIKGKNINFAVQVAKGKTCELLLYKRGKEVPEYQFAMPEDCLLYTSPSPRDRSVSRMPSSA